MKKERNSLLLVYNCFSYKMKVKYFTICCFLRNVTSKFQDLDTSVIKNLIALCRNSILHNVAIYTRKKDEDKTLQFYMRYGRIPHGIEMECFGNKQS